MLQTCISFTPAYEKLDDSCTLLTCTFNPSQPLKKDATTTPIKSGTIFEPPSSPSYDFTCCKGSNPKLYFPGVFVRVLKKLQCCSSSWLLSKCHNTRTNKECVLNSSSYFCGLCAQSFWVESSSKNRRMSIVHVLAGQPIRSGSFFSAFGICKLSRNWLRKGSNTMHLRCDGTSVLWNESWKMALSGRPMNWLLAKHSAWLLFGLCTCSIAAGTGTLLGPPALAEPIVERPDEDDIGSCGGSVVTATATSHGKKVLTDYSVIGIPGDGRCLFRAVAHGAHVRKGDGAPSESVQRESADVLRGKVVDELIKRREETEWFIEGNFDSYTKRMRQPHVWGGEPELLMASHVLRMPITVYMFEQRSRGLISIAEYGQEYAKENPDPITVLYHGFGHYDALQLPKHKT